MRVLLVNKHAHVTGGADQHVLLLRLLSKSTASPLLSCPPRVAMPTTRFRARSPSSTRESLPQLRKPPSRDKRFGTSGGRTLRAERSANFVPTSYTPTSCTRSCQSHR